MKEELTEKMHSEFTVSKEIEKKHKVGSAIEMALLLKKNDRKSFEEELNNFNVTFEDYLKWREHWGRLGLKIEIR